MATMKATAVTRNGAAQAMCSFHSIPKVCHEAVSPLTFDRRKSRGEHVVVGRIASAHPANSFAPLSASSSRYQGYTIHVPVMTVAQAMAAMTHIPTTSRRIRSCTPAVVRCPARMDQSPASPPPNNRRKAVPSTSPCTTVQNSLEERSNIAPPVSSVSPGRVDPVRRRRTSCDRTRTWFQLRTREGMGPSSECFVRISPMRSRSRHSIPLHSIPATTHPTMSGGGFGSSRAVRRRTRW